MLCCGWVRVDEAPFGLQSRHSVQAVPCHPHGAAPLLTMMVQVVKLEDLQGQARCACPRLTAICCAAAAAEDVKDIPRVTRVLGSDVTMPSPS